MRLRIGLFTGITLLVVAAGGASAPGPSRNGLVVFGRCCGAGDTGIFTIGPRGFGERRIFTPKADDAPLTPSWSPNGRRIAYVPGLPTGGLWTMRANGTDRKRVTRGLGDPLFPSWSPSGRWIAFADLHAPRARRNYDIWIVAAGGGKPRRLIGSKAFETTPAWAPNGKGIVYQRGRDLWWARNDGTRQRLLIPNASSPSWSPGGSRIAFIRGGNPWTVAADGKGARLVRATPGNDISLAWSPDGRFIVTAPIDRGDLMLVRADGSAMRRLTRAPELFNTAPSWQRLPARK